MSEQVFPFHEKGWALRQGKWVRLNTAQFIVALRLLELCEVPEELTGKFISKAMQEAAFILIEAFGSALPSRGIEHFANDPAPVLHDPLPLIWWRRIVDFADPRGTEEFMEDGDLPVHFLAWEKSLIIRALPARPEKRLAVVTDIEVDVASLEDLGRHQPDLAIEKAAAERAKATALLNSQSHSRAGRKADEEKIITVKNIAKDVVRDRFRTLSAFYDEVVSRYTEQDENGLEPKQVERWIFELSARDRPR